MENEIQKPENVSPNQMIQLAIESNADLDKVEKLLELKERHEANEARKVFASDFSVVQADMGVVIKKVVNPQTHSKYAKLEGVIEVSKPVYTKQGFSIIFYEGKTEVPENIRVYADVLHKAGHKETYHLDVPLDGVGIKGTAMMTKIHGKASSVSYGRRYLLCMIWNIPTQDDDDGAGAGKPKPKLPEITAENEKALAAIYVILQDALPFEAEIDEKKVAEIFYAGSGSYPADVGRAGVAAAWLLGLKRNKTWSKEVNSDA